MNSRRHFIKNTCAACFGLSALGVLLQSCAASKNVLKPNRDQDQFHIALDEFQQGDHRVIRHPSLPFDILVVKDALQFTALQMRCTHNDVALSYSGKKLICAAHGSEFDLKGQVSKEPASRPLTRYKTRVSDNILTIYLNQYASI